MRSVFLKVRYFFLVLFFLTSCAPELDDVVEEWNQKGWSKVRTHGIRKEFTRHSKLMSEKAQAVEASWIDKGKRKTKLYQQSSHHYLILRFFCRDDDEFVVVMKKRK